MHVLIYVLYTFYQNASFCRRTVKHDPIFFYHINLNLTKLSGHWRLFVLVSCDQLYHTQLLSPRYTLISYHRLSYRIVFVLKNDTVKTTDRILKIGGCKHSSNCSLFLGVVDNEKMSVLVKWSTVQSSHWPLQVSIYHLVAAVHWRKVCEVTKTRCSIKTSQ